MTTESGASLRPESNGAGEGKVIEFPPKHVEMLGLRAIGTQLRLEPETWADAQYAYGTRAWSIYGIELPEQDRIQDELVRAHEIATSLSRTEGRVVEKLGVLFVPPTAMTWKPERHGDHFRVKPELREIQGLQPDRGSNSTAPDSSWHILVADIAPRSAVLDSPGVIKRRGGFEFNIGYKVRGNTAVHPRFPAHRLGRNGYSALTLQSPERVDRDTWSETNPGLAAGFHDGAYDFTRIRRRFEGLGHYGVGPDDATRYRAAVHIGEIEA